MNQLALERERCLGTGISPWLAPLAILLTDDLALPGYFDRVRVLDRQHLPREGAVLLAPTHRARWDALLLPHAAGRRVTGRDCRFMVTIDEMKGLQGWFLHRLGCFAVDQGRPTLASLRYAIDLLGMGQQLVVFPEGRIQRDGGTIRL
ncbi:MAG: lysophospholipid acyltransferase family protein, partial [Synechococcaceae cyanobacterium ELA182]